MKKGKFLFPAVLCFPLAIWSINAQKASAQDTPQITANIIEEEEGPLLTKFEPGFQESNEERMAEIRRKRSILDTLDISERKRRRLLRDLYKNKDTERLTKILLADTEFEDVDQ